MLLFSKHGELQNCFRTGRQIEMEGYPPSGKLLLNSGFPLAKLMVINFLKCGPSGPFLSLGTVR